MFPEGNMRLVGRVVTNVPAQGDPEALGERVRAAAREAGYYREWGGKWTPRVSDIAREAGLPKGEISKVLSGLRGTFPSFDTVTKLARVFRVREEWLAFGRGPKKPMTAHELAVAVEAHPKLVETLRVHPDRWFATTLVTALHPETLESKTKSDPEGTPDGGWDALLDETQRGFDVTIADVTVVDAVDREHGRGRRLP
jgi:transcriptional regulator with XRE-family HTH domain